MDENTQFDRIGKRDADRELFRRSKPTKHERKRSWKYKGVPVSARKTVSGNPEVTQ